MSSQLHHFPHMSAWASALTSLSSFPRLYSTDNIRQSECDGMKDAIAQPLREWVVQLDHLGLSLALPLTSGDLGKSLIICLSFLI